MHVFSVRWGHSAERGAEPSTSRMSGKPHPPRESGFLGPSCSGTPKRASSGFQPRPHG
ncbi:Hypothetical protein A7982_10606 [Minicystis rosea]|nr:Hypothetical protein A7982_10606 [Minicystis rosea]